jgi:flagellar protein FlbD
VLQLTRLSGPLFALNPDLIERAEATPDTVVTLVNGSKYVIRETLEELVELIQAYRADIIVAAHHAGAVTPTATLGSAAAARSVAARAEPPAHSAGSMGTVVALHPGDE